MAIGDAIRMLEGSLAKMAIAFNPVDKVVEQRRVIATSVSMKVTPLFIQCIIENYFAEGLHVRSGQLMDAIKNCDVKIVNGYINAGLKTGFDKKVYVRAALFQHGGVRGSAGQKTKKKLKQAFKNSKFKSSGGFTYIAPRSFFKLTPVQLQMLREKYRELHQAAVDKFAQ